MIKVERSYHENGVIAAESPQMDGVPHGTVRHWHANGILAMEIPMNHGVIDGTVKQWNDKGDLIATSELKNGTGVLRTLNPDQGIDGESTYVNGKLTGRQLCFSGGDLIGIVYWLENKKVTEKRYREACKHHRNLPQYDDDRKQLGPTWLQKMGRAGIERPQQPIQNVDELPLKLLQGPRVREALAWLEESNQLSRSLGEATERDESIVFVKKLYGLGAIALHAVEINGGPNDNQNTGRIVIELPRDQRQRKDLWKFCGDIARETGFDSELDVGQRYLFLMLD